MEEIKINAEAEAVEIARPLAEPAKRDKGGFVWGTGRRKSSVARVRVRPGEGKFLVNNREVDDYFSEPQHREDCRKALDATKTLGQLDIFVNVGGGGITGQSGAILLGVARALKGYDPALEQALRDLNYLTRDPRKVERKKYGQRGARRRFQFSKR
ncbi:30S ribosomal protein S9 [Poriferisphaera corsica]|uniref:Small ribosomal subunit protein uS9 n=1 Tax=Poriferisphaera corsica TaxID=2528020 RepID=A0A517YRV1_9BACT|nr:30S ribosomal protein S9 [Poriferisphaera corsica]QDU32945.1 30S ribosomal protein S9 [Poriferisphaera corsica]